MSGKKKSNLDEIKIVGSWNARVPHNRVMPHAGYGTRPVLGAYVEVSNHPLIPS